VEVGLHEVLSGGVAPPGRPLAAQPLVLDLQLTGRAVLDVALGAPFAIRGTYAPAVLHLDGGPHAGGGPPGVVWGTARLLATRGIFYDLRLAPQPGASGAEVLELHGARRFVRGDLVASATTLEGELVRCGVVVGVVRLRFAARDDLGALFRSLRLGSSGSLARRRSP